jgi:hypothetical protein
VNNQRFIKSINSIANNYAFAVNSPIPTVLYTAEPMEEDAPVSDSDDYSFFISLAKALGFSAAVAYAWARSQNIKKFEECAKLINRWLKEDIIRIVSNTFRTSLGGSLGSPIGQSLTSNMGLTELVIALRTAWNAFKEGGTAMTQIGTAINNVTGLNNVDSPEEMSDIRKKLRNCITSFPGLVKDIFKKYVTDRLTNLPQDTLDKIRFAIDKYFNDGDLEAFAYAFVIGVGSAMTTALAVDAATLLVSGFSDSYGVGSTVLVAALAAGLVALSVFLLGGGSLATLGVWLSSTAANAAASAASAAGAALNPAALKRIQEILEKIARGLVPST